MAAENEKVGDHLDEVESVEEEEAGDELKNKIDNFQYIYTALKRQQLASVMATLPKCVRRRVRALKRVQLDAAKIEAKFFEEVHKLEAKYHQQMSPLYTKRNTIINGSYEPNEEESKWASDEEEDVKDAANNMQNLTVKDGVPPEANKETPPVLDENVKGIPDFWLTVFRNVTMLSEMVQEHDEPILKHLIDINFTLSVEPMGFTLNFVFSPNDYFTNKVLTKEYELRCEPDDEDPLCFEGPEIVKSKGCTIDWKKGKDVTKKTVKKKQKHKNRGVVRTVTRVVENDSFFNFFNPPVLPENAKTIDEDLNNLITSDYEIGHYIRDRIVPRAVLYYTGEAVDDDDDDIEEESEEEDEDEASDEASEDRDSANGQNCKQQ